MVLSRTRLPAAESALDTKQLLKRRVDEALRGAELDIDALVELSLEVLSSDLLSPAEREHFIATLEAETGLELRRYLGGGELRSAGALAREIALDARRGQEGASPSAILRQLTERLDLASLTRGASEAAGPEIDAPDRETAVAVREAVEDFAPQLDLDPSEVRVELTEEGPGQGRLGLMKGGEIALDAKAVDPDRAEGRAVVAHELAHVAQLEQRGAVEADNVRRIDRAEAEADAVFSAALTGKTLPVPEAKLTAIDEAACGPMSMNEKKQDITPVPITKGPEEEEEEELITPITPPITPVVIDDDEEDDDDGGTGDCLTCPEPDLEHQSVEPIRPFQPQRARAGQRELDIHIAGRRLRLLIPEEAAPGELRVELRETDSPFTALKLRQAVVRLDEDLNLVSGQLLGSVELGNYVKIDNVALQFDHRGAVDVHFRGVEVQINDDIRARVDLSLGHSGFHGAATVTAEAISLGPMYTIKDALLHVRIDPTGKFSAHGEVTFEVNGLFGVKLEACYVDGEWRGQLTFIWLMEFELFPGVTLKRASITGCFTKDHWWIQGDATLDVIDHFQVDASLKYEWKEGDSWWFFRGEVNQHTPLPIVEGVDLDEVHAAVEWHKDHWKPVTFGAKIVHEYVVGDIEGTWDIEKNEVDAEGGVTLVQPIPLGMEGASMEEAWARVYIVKNELTELKGAVRFVLPFEQIPTFEISAEDISYRFTDEKLNGFICVTLLRDLEFGDEEGLSATVFEGAGAVAQIEESAFGGMDAGLEFHVYNTGVQIGEGEVTFKMDPQYDFEGKATFELVEDWGVPHQELGPIFLLEEGYFEVSINNRTLGHAEAKNVRFQIFQPDGPGVIEGAVEGHLDFGTRLGNFTGTAKVDESWPLLDEDWGRFTLIKGGHVDVEITDSKLTVAEGFLPFQIDVAANDYTDAFTVTGHIIGDYDAAKDTVNGALLARLETPIVIAVPDTDGHSIVIRENTLVEAIVTDSEPDVFKMQLLAEYHDSEGILLAGSVTDALYDFHTGHFGFNGELVLKRELKTDLTEDGNWEISAVPELTRFGIEVDQSRIQRATGHVEANVYEGGKILLSGFLEGEATFEPELSFSAEAYLTLQRRLQWPPEGVKADLPPGLSFFLDEGSFVGGRIEDNSFSEAHVKLIFGVQKGEGNDLAIGNLEGKWYFETGRFDLAGDVKLTQNWYFDEEETVDEHEADMSKWRFALEKGSMLGFVIEDNTFQDAVVSVTGVLERGGEAVARGDVTGVYRPGQDGGFKGLATIDLVTDIHLGKVGAFDMYLGQGTGVTGRIEESKLVGGQLDIKLLARDGEVDKALLETTIEWDGGSTFSGQADLKVLDPIQLGEPIRYGDHLYSAYLSTETGGTIAFEENKLTSTSGNLTVDFHEGEELFARGTFSIEYDFREADKGVTAEGSLEILRTVDIGSAAGYDFTLEAGSGIRGRFADNALEYLEGELTLGIADEGGEQFARLSFNGRYEGGSDPDFSGAAGIEILREYDLGFEALGYSFHLQPESNFKVVLESSQLTEMSAGVGIIARQSAGGDEGMQGNVLLALQGTGVRDGEGWLFNGEAIAVVEGDINVGTAGAYAFSIQGGTGLKMVVENNRFTQIIGQLKGKVTENNVDFLGFECWVRYDAGEGPGDPGYVDAKGACQLLCEKELYSNGTYSFSVLPTEGPTAIIDVHRNEVRKVGGELAFRLQNTADQGNVLRIVGTAKGLYDNETQDFTGEGDIKLESDLNFKLTPDGSTKIVLKAGSGGNTAIKNNQLTRLGGTLKGELWTDNQPLVGLNAEGRYNAVTHKLEHFEGTATLLRDLGMGPANDPYLIVHQGLAAGILITDNKLMRLEATSGKLSVPSLNLTGGFDYLRYSCESGKDEYSASGWIQVDLLKEDADKGRFLRGKVDFTYNPDDTWDANGTVDFKVNHYIGGQARIHVDQELDPKLGGTLNIGPANMMEGRELFKKKLKLFEVRIQAAAGPVPITLNFGAEGFLGLDMLPLRLMGSVGFDDFYPNRMNTPVFTASANMDWGLRVKAALMAYADANIGVTIASLGVGVLGMATVQGDAVVSGGVTLNSDGSKYWGELGFGLRFAPTASVAVKPYVVARLGADFKKEFSGLSFDLGELFSWEYGKTLKFGDQPEAPAENSERNAVRSGGVQNNTSQPTSVEAAKSLSQENMPAAPSARPGEPQMESGAEMAGERKDTASESTGNAELDEKMRLIKELGEVVGAAADIIGQLADILGSLTFGVIGLVLMLCWKWIRGDLTRLIDNIMTVIDFLDRNYHLIQPYLPNWWNSFIEFAKSPSSAIDKWWNADVYSRQAVAEGEHIGSPVDLRTQLVNNLFAGWMSNADERAIVTIFNYSAGRGDLGRVIDGTKWNRRKFRGYSAFRPIMERAGVA